jgi:hypothetical protein
MHAPLAIIWLSRKSRACKSQARRGGEVWQRLSEQFSCFGDVMRFGSVEKYIGEWFDHVVPLGFSSSRFGRTPIQAPLEYGQIKIAARMLQARSIATLASVFRMPSRGRTERAGRNRPTGGRSVSAAWTDQPAADGAAVHQGALRRRMAGAAGRADAPHGLSAPGARHGAGGLARSRRYLREPARGHGPLPYKRRINDDLKKLILKNSL